MRELSPAEDGPNGPIKSREERRCTDRPMLYCYIGYLVIFLALAAYCAAKANFRQLTHHYDHCGNFCGLVTDPVKDPKLSCTGADYRDKKYLLTINKKYMNYDDEPYRNNDEDDLSTILDLPNGTRVCVESCDYFPNYVESKGMCVPESNKQRDSAFDSFKTDVTSCIAEIIICIVISIALTILLVYLLKAHPRVMVWGMLVLYFILIAALIVWLIMIRQIIGAIICFIVLMLLLAVVICLRSRIRLVIELFREAGKAVGKMPLLFTLPFVTFLIHIVLYCCLIGVCLVAFSAARLTYGEPNYQYKNDAVTVFTYLLNIFAFLWTLQFINGCQHMTIAGAVALWFFTRKKDELQAPIKNSFINVTHFHLGSILLGSLIIALIQMLRMIVDALKSEARERGEGCAELLLACCSACIQLIEDLIAFLNRNAYIQIAIHGFGFCKAGKRAFKLIMGNLPEIIAINSAGDIVLNVGKFLVVFITVIVAAFLLSFRDIEMLNRVLICIIIALFAYFFAHSFMSVYEMVIDTIFICYCEDSEMNDGSAKRPYYMSANLKKFVQETKEMYEREPGIKQRLKNMTRSSDDRTDRRRS